MTTAAMGARSSEPAPLWNSSGSSAKTSAAVVIRIGRRRRRPAWIRASLRSYPCSMSWSVKSTIRMAFLVTMPVSRMTPSSEMRLSVRPVSQQAAEGADEGHRQREHDRERSHPALVQRDQQHVDQDDRELQRPTELVEGIALLLRAAAELEGVAGREDHVRAQRGLDVVADVAGGPAGRVGPRCSTPARGWCGRCGPAPGHPVRSRPAPAPRACR